MKRISKSSPTKISDLFEVYRKKLRAPEGSVLDVVIDVVHDLLGIELTRKAFSYTPVSKTLRIHAPGTIKSEILLKREEILAHVRGRLGEKDSPTTIL